MCNKIVFIPLMLLVIYAKSEEFENETIDKFCDYNSLEVVLWDGIQYRITRNDLMANFDETTASVGPLYELDILNEADGREMHYQSMCRLDFPFDESKCNRMGSPCAHLREIRDKVLAFTYDNNGKQYISRTTDKQIVQNRLNEIDCILNSNLNDTNRVKRWPKYTACSDQIFKPSTYWPNKQMLIFIFNSYLSISTSESLVNVSIPPIIAIRSTVIPDWGNGWTLFNINEKQKMSYLTAFWWKYTDEVYIVAEIIGRYNSGGYVFRFDHTNPQNLIATNIRVIDFFGCNGKAFGFGNTDTTKSESTTTLTSATSSDKSPIVAYIILSVVIVVILVLIILLILICVVCKRRAASTAPNRITIRSENQPKGFLKQFKLVRNPNTIESNSDKTTEDGTARTASTDDEKVTSQASVNTIDSDTGKQVN